MRNIDEKTVASFGDEWSRFDQTGMADDEACKVFDEYFAVFPWADLEPDAEGFDMGCGSGRWATAPKTLLRAPPHPSCFFKGVSLKDCCT